MALFNMFQGGTSTKPKTKIAYSDFIEQAQTGGISEVLIEGQNLTGLTSDGRRVSSYKPDGADIVDVVVSVGVVVFVVVVVDVAIVLLADGVDFEYSLALFCC